MEMIERVARAIALREAEIMLGADRSQQIADPRELARAAIEAMQEPTLLMLRAGPGDDLGWHPMISEHIRDDIWRAMTAEALKLPDPE